MSDQFFKTREETQAWLDMVGVQGYTIHDDLTVDVDRFVNLYCKNMEHFPVKFGVIKDDFACGNNKLTSLDGAPVSCRRFSCGGNRLTSLMGAPKECTTFECGDNLLIDLNGSPVKCGFFVCSNNKLTSLAGLPQTTEALLCNSNLITRLIGIPINCRYLECKNNPTLVDISAVPKGCEVRYDHDVVVKNQAARQLVELESRKTSGGVLIPKAGRIL